MLLNGWALQESMVGSKSATLGWQVLRCSGGRGTGRDLPTGLTRDEFPDDGGRSASADRLSLGQSCASTTTNYFISCQSRDRPHPLRYIIFSTLQSYSSTDWAATLSHLVQFA